MFGMKRNATFSVNLEPELNERLRKASDESGVAISAIARAAILAAIEFYEEHGFFTMPVKFQSFSVQKVKEGEVALTTLRSQKTALPRPDPSS